MTDSMVTTIEETEERAARAAQLTPSEKAFAKILAAWDEWPDRGDWPDPARDTLLRLTPILAEDGWVHQGRLTAIGRDLRDRAREAGVL